MNIGIPRMDGWMKGQKDECMKKQKGEGTDRQDKQMDGWKNQQ